MKQPHDSKFWWRDRELVFLILLVLGTYFTRLTALTVRGEESRRGVVAMGMLETHEWFVPKFQGNPMFLSSRPPLHNWTIALFGALRGQVDLIAIRLPSVIALLFVVITIYGYSRTVLPKLVAFAAGAAFATFGGVLQLGRLGESDLLFTFFVSSSQLLWHVGYLRKWPARWTWCFGYSFAALATLTKGLQGPVYFMAPVATYLLFARNWRFIFSWAHATGVAVFVMIWGAWQLPCALLASREIIWHIYFGDILSYGNDRSLLTVVKHLVMYPLELLAGGLLPWSVLLLPYLRSDFRRRIGAASDHVLFLSCCLAVTFPTVWFVTHARTRFYLPLYPCLAILIGVAIQRCLEAESPAVFRLFWSRFVALISGLMLLAGTGILAIALVPEPTLTVRESLGFAVTFFITTVLLAGITFRSRLAQTPFQASASVAAIATFLGLFFVGVYTNTLVRAGVDRTEQWTQLRAKLPSGVLLFSLEDVDHGFAIEFGKTITRCAWPGARTQLPSDVEYFCFRIQDPHTAHPFAFAWEPIGVLSYGRTRGPDELNHLLVVARRLKSGPPISFRDVVRSYEARLKE